MASVKPMLGDIELELVQKIEVEEDQVLTEHSVPALEGDFLQRLERRATRVKLTGVMTGPEAGEALKTLREKFRQAEPVSFVADIATATKVDKVLIEEMGVRELAGKPERFEYELTLREFTPAPRTTIEDPPTPPPPPPPPPPKDGKLIVEVIVEGQPNFDFNLVKVEVSGTKANGSILSPLPLTNRVANEWTEEIFPPGQYTASALVNDPAMTGSAQATVQPGQTTRALIRLRPGAVIAKAFVVHFRFDKSFVEPCMRGVLRQVAKHALDNPRDKLVIVGHTDKTGSDKYNQSLSERRARSVFAYLTSGRDPAASNAEWNLLRQQRPPAVVTTIGDTWGVYQYQYILQALGFYPGVVDGDHRNITNDAVQAFRQAKGLPAGTTVDDPTWEALIRSYFEQDAAIMKLGETQLLPNASSGCDGGALKWLGCGEESPLPLPQPTLLTPFRPYRRVEMLFVRVNALPCDVPRPDTLDMPPLPPPGGARTWCLATSNPTTHCCFATRNCAAATPGQWCITPAEPGTVIVRGRMTFEDGSPAANVHYVLMASDGEFMDGENVGDRQNPRRIDGILGKTNANGEFQYPDKPKGIGIYTLEIRDQFIARLSTEPRASAKGNVVCKRMDGTSNFDVILIPEGRNTATVNPVITLASPVVVVKKPNTNPARQIVTLRTDAPFFRSGTFASSSAAISFFRTPTAGTAITFNGTDDVFTGAELTAGVQLFAEGVTPSAALDDVQLTLTLTPGATSVGPPATVNMTSVELTLDICAPRVSPAINPIPLSTANKLNPGRFLQLQDPARSNERAMLIVRPPNPPTFTGELVLTPRNTQVQVFNVEIPGGESPLPGQQVIPTGSIPPGGANFFAEGAGVSNTARDTGFQIGIRNVENDGDNVAITVLQLDIVAAANGVGPTSIFVRFGLWDHAFDSANGNLLNNAVAESINFIGQDSRHFFFRLRDPSAAGTVTIQWRTILADGTDDDAPGNPALTLTETASGSHLFVSKAVMLVTDIVDRGISVNSGLTAPATETGQRSRGQTNFRIRRATVDDIHQLDGRVAAVYTPSGGGNSVAMSAVYFDRSPEERKRVRMHVVNVRRSLGGAGIMSVARFNSVKLAFQSIYARCGVFAEVDEILVNPPASCTAWPTLYRGDPIAISPSVEERSFATGSAVPSSSEQDLITLVQGLSGFSATDIYVVCVSHIYQSPVPAPPGALTDGPGGHAFADIFTTAGSTARGFAFVGIDSGVTEFAEVHEATHITTNFSHFDLGAAGATAPGNIDGKNNMHRFFLRNDLGASNPKRLWNDTFTTTALTIPPQINAIRGSRFVRNF